ncbi:hypothetical protein GCM10022393_19900 [Aquimarina addita]|uniref:DUF308 domain-containing protein n=1 Tax=Aquimarina addita TaxID=870485 RepID=A0ABP6UKD6_9FLAO
MNKIFYLALSGLMLLATGVFLFFSERIGVETNKIMVPLLLLVSGISAIIFSKNDQLPKIANQYHLFQGLGLIAYGVILFFLAESLNSFLLISTYFVLMYGLFEIVLIFGVMSSKHKINKGILMSRIVAGALNLLGGFILLLVTLSNKMNGLIIASILIVIAGIGIVIFARKLVKNDLLQTADK